MQLHIVNDSVTTKQFHRIPHLVYKGDENWAAPLTGMVEDTFNPKKNPSFKNGEAQRWVLTGSDGKLS